jgi:hypothetical protein
MQVHRGEEFSCPAAAVKQSTHDAECEHIHQTHIQKDVQKTTLCLSEPKFVHFGILYPKMDGTEETQNDILGPSALIIAQHLNCWR